MIFPWPEHVKMTGVLYFALALMIVEIILGTSPVFALLIFMYVIFVALALNLAGGLYTVSGSFIAFQSLQSLLLSQIAKCAFLQRADSNLRQPLISAAIYTVGEVSLVGACWMTRKFRLRTPILDARRDYSHTMAMSITASTIGIASAVLVGTVGSDKFGNVQGGSIWSYLGQMGNFLLIGVLLGTAHIIRTSGGRRSARWWTIVPLVTFALLGVANNTKQGIYEPLAVWFLCCALYRYKFNRLQILGIILAGVAGVMVVFPVVQYSRAYVREGNLVNRTKLVYNFMRDNSITDIRAAYKAQEELREEDGTMGYYFYYGKDEGILDRISLISTDDAVVNYTQTAGYGGYEPFRQAFISMIPRFIFKDKDRYLSAAIVNVLGRETGMLAPSDETTYIAFSLFGPSYYMGGWFCVTVVTFVVISFVLIVLDSFYGDARVSIYALIPIAGNIHGAAEVLLPVAFDSLLHLCVIGAFTLWALRKLSVVVHVFISKYSWYEQSPTSMAVPRSIPGRFAQDPRPLERVLLRDSPIAPASGASTATT